MKMVKKVVAISICAAVVFMLVLVNRTRGEVSDTSIVSASGMISDSDKEQEKESIYDINKYGETYGRVDPDSKTEPDLVAVTATNGKEGYIKQTEFDEKAGGNVASPEEAIEYEKNTAGKSIKLPVYNKDGDLVIGFYEVSSVTREETTRLKQRPKK